MTVRNCLEEQKVKIIYSKFYEIFLSYAGYGRVLLIIAFYFTKPHVRRCSVG